MRNTLSTADTMQKNKHVKIKHTYMQYTETCDNHYT